MVLSLPAPSILRQLGRPQVIFQNNHLLIINKPAGFSCSSSTKNNKCLLTFLQNERLGGGSEKTYLKPLHRIDQPCTGIFALAKTTRAARKIQPHWKGKVKKSYLCAMEDTNFQTLLNASKQNGEWFTMEAYFSKMTSQVTRKKVHESNRHCVLKWRRTLDNILEIQTSDGARHMIRLMLSQIGHCPIAGDLRYGARAPLPDQSVALHARSLVLPPIGDAAETHFVAPIPPIWSKTFGVTEDSIKNTEITFRL